jgi:hypothetical protein
VCLQVVTAVKVGVMGKEARAEEVAVTAAVTAKGMEKVTAKGMEKVVAVALVF